MPKPTIVDDLVNQVRDQIDEANAETISDADILQVLNRAQDFGVDILARHYEDPFIAPSTLTLVAGTDTYDLPDDTFEDRLQKVEVLDGSTTWEVARITYREVAQYELTGNVDIPAAYVLYGRTIRFLPTPSGAFSARLWRMVSPESLVVSQGRIDQVSVAGTYVLVDSIGSGLSTTGLGAYVNLVDGQSGIVKATLQVASLVPSTGRVSFKTSSLDKTTVYNRAIGLSLPTTVAADDYVCEVGGTCVPYFKRPLTNFMIQYAVEEIRRRLSDNPDIENRALAEFAKQVEHTWSGRENRLRVANRSRAWTGRGWTGRGYNGR